MPEHQKVSVAVGLEGVAGHHHLHHIPHQSRLMTATTVNYKFAKTATGLVCGKTYVIKYEYVW